MLLASAAAAAATGVFLLGNSNQFLSHDAIGSVFFRSTPQRIWSEWRFDRLGYITTLNQRQCLSTLGRSSALTLSPNCDSRWHIANRTTICLKSERTACLARLGAADVIVARDAPPIEFEFVQSGDDAFPPRGEELSPPNFRETSSGLLDVEKLELQERVRFLDRRLEELESLLSTAERQAQMIQTNVLEVAAPAAAPLFGDGLLLQIYIPGETRPRHTTLISTALWQTPQTTGGSGGAGEAVPETSCRPSLALNAAALGRLRLSTVAQYSYKISGSIYFEESGRYWFRLQHLTGDLRISVNGASVMSNWIGMEAADQMANGGVDTDHFSVDVDTGPTQILLLSQGAYATTFFDLCVFRENDHVSLSDELDGALVLNTQQLYPSESEAVCGLLPTTFIARCAHTFEDALKLANSIHVACDAGCEQASESEGLAAEHGQTTESTSSPERCYSPGGRICAIAQRDGFLGSRGGTLLIKKFDTRYCIEQVEARGMPWALRAVVPTAADANSTHARAGVVGSDSEVLLALEYGSTQRIASVDLVCGQSQRAGALADLIRLTDDTSLALTSGESLPLLTHLFLDKPQVQTDARLFAGPQVRSSVPSLFPHPLNGWSRLTCASGSLFQRAARDEEQLQHVSAAASCTSTFRDVTATLRRHDQSVVVSCDALCDYTEPLASTAPGRSTQEQPLVKGFLTYTEDSVVCAASQHAGVIGKHGGAVQIIPGMPPVRRELPEFESNGIRAKATTAADSEQLAFYVDVPRGQLCSYPEVTRISRGSDTYQDVLPNGGRYAARSRSQTIELVPEAVFLQTSEQSENAESAWATLMNAQENYTALLQRSDALSTQLLGLSATLASRAQAALRSTTDLMTQLALEPQRPSIRLVPDILAEAKSRSKVGSVLELGSVWDAATTDSGPSAWSVSSTDDALGIMQSSAITATDGSPYGATLIFAGAPYADSFMQATLNRNYRGTAALLFHYVNPRYFQALEVARLGEGGVSLRLIESVGGSSRSLFSRNDCSFSGPESLLVRFSSESISVALGQSCTGSFKLVSSAFISAMREQKLAIQGSLGLATNGLSTPVVFSNVRFGPQSSLSVYADEFVKLEAPAPMASALVSVEPAVPSALPFAANSMPAAPEGCVERAVVPMSLDENWVAVKADSAVQESWSASEQVISCLRSQVQADHDPGVGVLLYTRPVCTADGCVRVEASLRLTEGSAGIVYDLVDELNMRALFINSPAGQQQLGVSGSVFDVKDGVASTLRNSAALPRRVGGSVWHNVTALLCESEQQVWVDSLPLVKQNVRRLSTAPRRVGLGIGSGQASWRYLRISHTE